MITSEQVTKLHNKLEFLGLCKRGILHPDLLDSAIAGQQWHSNTFDQYVHIASSINANHVLTTAIKELATW